ncbi:MAG: helix-turn-helix domain-containing protein [Clostridia bacterium]|nr:helix-turn-helix domain-containing protein [Clostridia bacterium]
MRMNNSDFRKVLTKAVSGDIIALAEILKLYEGLVNRFSYIYWEKDEDLKQYLMGKIVENIKKFKI